MVLMIKKIAEPIWVLGLGEVYNVIKMKSPSFTV